MDLDAFAAEHGPQWRRLGILLARPRRKLTAAEVDEMVFLYRRAATHLSIVQSRSPDPDLVATLSQLVLRARARLSPAPGFRWATLGQFFTVSFPGEVYRAGRWCAGVAAGFVGLAAVLIAIVASDPDVALRFLSPAEINSLVEHDFEAYYSNNAPENFGFAVWTNNAWVSALCLASGVLVLPVLYLLWSNVLNLGLTGGIMVGNDRADVFYGLLLVHGLLELTCVFVAAGVGLRIGWAWIAPGPLRTRAQAVAVAGRSAVVVALGLTPVLLLSGAVEAGITPSPLPTVVKLAIGALVWLAFLGYVTWFGALAVRQGRASDLGAFDREVLAPTV
ncbi:stage II sporulation protein M [Micromonospora sp. NPDC049559]|uniref:stage II sporulation protein M n=1 Tax=Micromonospora sp. NPDC049559 TaxID=3155923 RepID=UPI003431DEA9